MKFIFSVLCAILLFSSCSKYGNVRLNYPTRPLLMMPDNIKRLALANRSVANASGKKHSIFEAVLSGEVAGSDRMASAECLRGVYDRYNGWRNIQVIPPGTINMYGTGTSQVPDQLSWDDVKAVCDSVHADALLVLETFDSNSNAVRAVVNDVITSVATNSAPTPPQIRMTVTAFWRLYDPYRRQILDEFQSVNFMTFPLGGSLQVAPPDALPRTAYYSGQQYIQRYLPTYYSVKRDMYKRGKGSEKRAFLSAFRRAEVADWAGAAEAWAGLTKSTRRVNAGRACLDLAVSYEVLGNIQLALTWAQKAYEDYRNPIARTYVDHLKFRLQYE